MILNFRTKLTKTGYLWSTKGKNENHHWILHIRISLGSKALQQTILILQTNFPEKGYFRSKTEEMNFTIELFIFELVYVLNFSLNWHLRFFGPNLPKNGKQVFPVKNREGERHHCFLYIQISLGSKFSLNWQFKFFGPNLSKEGISGLKTKKVNITIKFCIL